MKSFRNILIASSGGHLSELLSAMKHIDNKNYLLLTNRDDRSENIEIGYAYKFIHNPHTSFLGYIKNLFQIAIILFDNKPKHIISTGAGIAVPAMIIAYVFSVKFFFIETIARPYSNSRTGNFAKKLGFKIFRLKIKFNQ